MANVTEPVALSTAADGVPNKGYIQDMGSIIVRSASIIMVGVLAIFGNSLVVSVVLKYKKLRTSANVFVCNLSLVGIIIGMMLPALTANIIRNRNTFGFAGCSAWGMLIVIFFVIENNTFALISFSRYYLITNPQSFNKFFSLRSCLLYCALTWLVGLLMAIGTVAGWSEIDFNPKSKACSYSRVVGQSYHYFLISVSFGIPLIISFVAYALLYKTVRRSARRIRTKLAAGNDAENRTTVIMPHDSKADAARRKDWKLTRMLIITFVVYLVCLGPYSFVNMVDERGELSEYVHVTVTWILFSNVAINPLVYGLLNKTFRDAYSSLFKKKLQQTFTHSTQID